MQQYNRWLIIILIVVALAAWVVYPNTQLGDMIGRNIETRLGLDLVGGVQALLEADLPEGTPVDSEAMDTAVNIVENRVNGMGVNEAVVQKAGERRIVVELPGETDPEAALAALKQTGVLEFVDFTQLSDAEIAMLLNAEQIQTDFASSAQGAESPTPTPAATEGVTQTLPIASGTVYHTIMTGSALRAVAVDRSEIGQYQVAFQLTDEGARIFSDFTSRNVGRTLAIVLDKKVISAPTISVPITDGQGVITGQFTYESANALAIQLRYGSLPIPLKVVESRTVGPTLGEDSLIKSQRAGIIGFSIIILFMLLYYRLPGLVANVAILIYALLAFALFRFIPVTLTLPGIAGFLLSTGSALDANILIFERLKEELRAGRTLSQAIEMGWKRAWPSIRDSNIATLITCSILFWFGSTFGATIVKGFSLTLALGVAVSLFTAIVVTRALLTLVLNYFKPENRERWFGI